MAEKAAVVLFTMVMAGFDLAWYRIPNLCIAAGAAVFVFLRIRGGGTEAVYLAFVGLLLPFILCLPLFALSMIGAGDVKLLMVLGIFAGPAGILRIMLYAVFLAGAAAAIRVFRWKIGIFRAVYLLDYAKEMKSCLQSSVRMLHKERRRKDQGERAWLRPYIQEADIQKRKPWLMHLSVPIAGALLLYLMTA